MSLINYLPSFYYGSNEVVNIQCSLNVEADTLKKYITDLLNQFFIDTATWGLAFWESELGLNIDENERQDSRRSRIKTRLRRQGTITTNMIKNICSSFSGGEVEVIENTSNYEVIIKFVGTVGIPSNMQYLKTSLAETLPAHLGFSFEYTFNSQKDIMKFTHLKLKQYSHYQLRNEKINV